MHYSIAVMTLLPSQKVSTYVNQSLKQQSRIDYMLVSKGCFVKNFVVLDPDVNFSDHLPLLLEFTMPRSRTRTPDETSHTQCFIQGPFLGELPPPQTSKLSPQRIFGHACREAKNNVNTRLTSLTKCLMF